MFYIQLGLFNIACYYILFSRTNKVSHEVTALFLNKSPLTEYKSE